MSQVIVTNDELKTLREKSREQERRISREDEFRRWRRNDITGPDLKLRVIGMAILPVVGLWALLGTLMTAMLRLAVALFRVLGQVIGSRKPLTNEH